MLTNIVMGDLTAGQMDLFEKTVILALDKYSII